MSVRPDELRYSHIAFGLITESPESRLLLREPTDLSRPERLLRVGLWFRGLIESFDPDPDDLLLVVEKAASLSGADRRDVLDMLRAIGARTELRRIALFHRLVFGHQWTLDSVVSVERCIDRVASNERRLWRIFGRLRYDGFEQLTQRLHEFLLKNKREFAAFRTELRKYKDTSLESDAWKPSAVSGGGELSVVVLRENDAVLAVVDRWLQHAGGAMGLTGPSMRPMDSMHDVIGKRGAWVGRGLVVPRATQLPTYTLPAEAVRWTTDAHITALAGAYPWSLCPWVSTYHERAIAFVSRDSRLAEAFSGIARRCGSDLLSIYQGIGSFEAVARGVVFAEEGDFGTAALVAADHEQVEPLLILEISNTCGDWWREAAACLPSVAMSVSNDRYQRLLVAYRVTDRDAYLKVWRKLESDSNVALAVVSGRTTPDRALRAFEANHGAGFRDIVTLSRKLGWVYAHEWGGGSSEQHAMFHAQDAALTRCVRDYAGSRSGGGWGGVWGSW